MGCVVEVKVIITFGRLLDEADGRRNGSDSEIFSLSNMVNGDTITLEMGDSGYLVGCMMMEKVFNWV